MFSDFLFFPGLQGRLRQIVLNQERGRCERQAWRITAQLSRFASGGSGQGRSAPPPQRFNPLVQHLAVPLQLRCHPAAQLDLPLIEQAAKPLHRRLLSPGEAVLLAQQPVDLGLGDHPGAEALEEQLASGHRFVTTSSHSGGTAGLPRGLGLRAAARKPCHDRAGLDVYGASRSLMKLAMIFENVLPPRVHVHPARAVRRLHGRLRRPLVRRDEQVRRD